MRQLLPGTPGDLDGAYAWPGDGCLRVNFVASIDGAATRDGRSAGLSSPADKQVFHHLRATCDVILVGAGTARREAYKPARVPVALVSNRLSLDREDRVFHGDAGTARPIVLCPRSSDASRRSSLEHVADVVVCGDQTVDLLAAVASLRERGMRRILCEGGPTLFADVLAAGLVDEVCLTIAPMLAGGRSLRITDGPALDGPAAASLTSVMEADDQLLLRYRLG
jgi:riboflavin-specific deaminase-like protein